MKTATVNGAEIEQTAEQLLQAIRAAAARHGNGSLAGQLTIEVKMGDCCYLAMAWIGQQKSEGKQ